MASDDTDRGNIEQASSAESENLLVLCRSQRWSDVKECITANPKLALASIKMENHNWTTILHQVITSKSSDISARYSIIKMILASTPDAAAIANGYGSLALHVVTQRNIKMDAPMKENVILALIDAYPQALLSAGGVGKRTPLHIAFTDYVSSRLISTMIRAGGRATTMRDKHGWLPIHIACSRHASPEKINMLLQAYPESINVKTNDGQSPLSLAVTTATSSHPNHKLIQELRSQQLAATTSANVRDLSPNSPVVDRSKKVKFRDGADEKVSKVARANDYSAVSPLPHHKHQITAQENCVAQFIHRQELHSEEDKEHALNLLFLQSGFLDSCRFSNTTLLPTVTPSSSFPLPTHHENKARAEAERTLSAFHSTPSNTRETMKIYRS